MLKNSQLFNKTVLMSLLLGVSINAQAVKLTFDGTHQAVNTEEYFLFDNKQPGNVTIYTDTLTDGYGAGFFVWKPMNVAKPDLPEGVDWEPAFVTGSQGDANFDFSDGIPAPRPYVNAPENIFGVSVKNTTALVYDPTVTDEDTGLADAGRVFDNLDAGRYLVTVYGPSNEPNGLFSVTPDDPMRLSRGFFGFEQIDTSYGAYRNANFPHDYKLYIEGDVAKVSSVPVPAAVWLFMSALTGLGIQRRKALAA